MPVIQIGADASSLDWNRCKSFTLGSGNVQAVSNQGKEITVALQVINEGLIEHVNKTLSLKKDVMCVTNLISVIANNVQC